MNSARSGLLWTIRILVAALLFVTPLLVSTQLFFPFITGKNFFFRIVVEVMFGAWIALAAIDPSFRPRKSPLLAVLLLFIGALGLSTIFGAYPYHSFWSNFERMEGYVTYLHLAAFFLVLSHTFRSRREWWYLACVSVLASFFVTTYGFCEHIIPQSQTDSFCFTGSGGARPYATFGNAIYLAVYLLFHLFLLGGMLRRTRVEYKALLVPLMLAEAYLFFLASSRGAFIGASAGLVLIALFSFFYSQNKKYRLAAAGMILAVFALFIAIRAFPSSRLVRGADVLDRLARVSVEKLTTEPRVRIWGMGLRAFQERPLLGWGPENFIIPYAKYYNPNLFGNEPWFDRVHNMFIEWLVASGIIGFALYLGLFVAVVVMLLRALRDKKIDYLECAVALGLTLSYLVQDAFVFDNITTFLFLFSGLAFVHSLSGEEPSESFVVKKTPSPSPVTLVVVAGTSIVLVIVMYVVNVRPMIAARQIIVALTSVSQTKSVSQLIANFDDVIQMNTFGTTEVRERFADLTVQAAIQAQNPSPEFAKLISYNATQLEEEHRQHPDLIKYTIFLGKLYSVQAAITGEGADKSEAYYKEAVEKAPNYIQGWLGLAELYLITRQEEKAGEVAKHIMTLPDDRETISRLIPPVISVDLLVGKYQEASNIILDYKEHPGPKSIPQFLGITETRSLVSRALARTDHLSERKAFLELLLGIFEESHEVINQQIIPTILIGSAQTEGELGNISKAREFALRAESLDPSYHDQVQKFLGSLGTAH